MRSIAWVLPSLVGNSVSRYCAEAIVPVLNRRFAIKLYSPTAGSLGEERVHLLSELGDKSADLVFVHCEDIVGMDAVRIGLGGRASVAWFHDVVFPGSERGLELSLSEDLGFLAALFSSFRNQAEFRRMSARRATGASQWSLPFPVVLGESASRWSARSAVAFGGSPWNENRADRVLTALQSLPRPPALYWLLEPEEQESAQRLLERYSDQATTLIVGRSPERWREILESAGVALHLHVSAFGDPGPYLPLSWGAGVPTVVSDFAEGEHIPRSIAVRIAPGIDEASDLCAAIGEALSGSAETLRRRGAALDYVREFHHHLQLSSELERLFSGFLGSEPVSVR